MDVKFYNDIPEFYNLVLDFLLEKEAENNLLFSILSTLKINPKRYGEENPILITVNQDDEIKLVSLRTPPYNQIISYTRELNPIDLLVNKLLQRNIEIPGVIGFKEGVERFIYLWCKNKNLKSQLVRNERVYKLGKVVKEILGSKVFIVGSEKNQAVILDWAKKFVYEALPETEESLLNRALEAIKEDIKNKKIFLLKDNDKIVSMARKAGKTPNGNLVNLVYTPPELRRRGYATECVAKLSKYLLKEGNKFCFLLTDLINPISNNIYQKIGYRPVIDIDEYKFIKK
ncbi:MAG: GNAT family N-acetyltransferase [Promethearchaeota archaeon]